ncbi:MAG: GNAT family N-acetyltransferase [Planctomycetes bacterium]|nr:GNAT family N-acetyltransferase [Planctomycetota bacterium]
MQQFVLTETPQQLTSISAVTSLPAVDPDVLVRHKADSHWALIDHEGSTIGHCSLWWHNTPPYRNHRIGVIGHYAVSDRSAARQVLQHACEELAANGCTMAVGPMDGNTWRQYRLVTEFGAEPPFFLEPNSPEDWPGHFVENGFKPLAEYFSALNTDLRCHDPLLSRVENRMNGLNIRIRSLNPTHFDDDLRRIFSVATVSFRNNPLYMTIDEEDFIGLYRPLQEVVRHELVMIAERHNVPVGFIFAVPDLLQAKRGETIDTVIVKTLGVLPRREYAGLGHLLLGRARSAARELGYTRLIHALMRDVGHLRRMSGRYGRPIRRYTLFAKEFRS